MKRRVPSIGQQMASYMKPRLKGKIDCSSLGYKFGDEGYTNPQGVHLKAHQSDDGRMVSLYKRRTVSCPLLHEGSDHPKVNTRYSVPETVCKKCLHRLPGGCCDLLRRAALNSLKVNP